MTYASGGLIEALDYNNFAASVNAIWGSGGSPTLDYGYGQASISGVLQSATVAASEWATLISRLDSLDRHQTNTTSGITPPTSNTTITYLSSIGSLISTLTSSRLTTALARVSATATVTNATTWSGSSVKTIRLTWPNANAMRYFFNAGGNIQMTAVNSILCNNSKSLDWDALLNNCGTVNITAQDSSKTGGGGTPTINPNTVLIGFYDLTTSNQSILQQYSTTVAGTYTSNYALFQAVLNAAPGSSTTMDLTMTLVDGSPDEALPAGQNDVQGTVRFDVIINAPSSSYLTNVWGIPTATTTPNVANIYPTVITNTQA